MGSDVVPRWPGCNFNVIRIMLRSIQVHMHVSKKSGFHVRTLRCIMIHDILSKYSVDFRLTVITA
jgi:hypothetical protein